MHARFISLACLFAIAASAHAQTPAFPGAEGFGRFSTGGRGGDIAHVTTLADSGPGSLRDAVSKENRTVIFDVGGYILLKSPLHVASRITIAGQSAPGDGIAIAGAEVSLSNSHDLILRYLRIRQGLSPGEDRKSAINMVSAKNIILDHVSVAWGRWDTIDMNLCENVTVQYCMIGPGIDPQRFGCLCQSDGVTWSHNLWISNQSRNPKAKGKIQYINNVIYNWGVCGLVGGHSATDHVLDVIGNTFIAGPSSTAHFLGEFTPTDHVYQRDNQVDMTRDGKLNPRPVTPADFSDGKGAPTTMPAVTILDAPPVTIDSALDAYKKVLATAGDSLHRDEVDQKLIADVQSLGLKGATLHDPAAMGGLGNLKSTSAATRAPAGNIPANPSTIDKNGYTILEEYLNAIADGSRR